MNNLSPILRDLRHLQLPSNIHLEEQWEISDVHDEDVVWNIVMAYLNYFPRNDDSNEVERRLKTLGVKCICKNIDDSVKKYNPFLRRNVYYCEKTTNCIVKPFKESINKFVQNYYESDFSFDFDKCLEICTILLSCSILVVTIKADGDLDASIELFPRVRKEDWPSDIKVLVVFKTFSSKISEHVEQSQETFSFGMSKEYGLIKQRIALKEILKSTTYKNETADFVMKKVLWCPGVQEHFLSALLNGGLGKYVQDIYKSSYVLTKLRDAGFQTDPRAVDKEGKSALYFALCGEDVSLLYFLYDHAANACFLENCSVRCPNKSIIESLRILRSHLEELRRRKEPRTEKFFYDRKLEEILRLNSFQIHVCSTINQINEKYEALIQHEQDSGEKNSEKSDNSHLNNSREKQRLLETEQRKEVILSILKTYQEYFFWSDETGIIDSLILYLEEFGAHNNYFENLDFCSTVMFFDKLFLLKERLKLPVELYTQIESKFFFLIYSKKYLVENKKPEIVSEDEVFRMVSLQVRLHLEKSICSFKEELERFPIIKETIVKRIPNNAVETLTNLSLIYDEFLINRLKHYLDIAIRIRIKDKDFKSVLVIERALQVVGECLTITDKGFKTVQKIFPLILPKYIKQYLVNIRNKLCHFTADEIENREIAENDINMFKSIQKELEDFKNILMPIIFTAHEYAMDRFVLTFFYSIVKTASKNNASHECSEGSQQNFEQILFSLTNQISTIDKENENKMRKLRKYFRYPVENSFKSIRNEMKEMDSKKSVTEIKQEMGDYIWTVEFILQSISTDESLKDYQNILSQKISERKILFAGCQSKPQMSEEREHHEDIDMNSVLFYENVFQKNINSSDEERKTSSSEDGEKLLKDVPLHTTTKLNSKSENTNEKTSLMKKFDEILVDYEKLSKEMLETVQSTEKEIVLSDFKNLTKLRHILHGKPCLNAEEKQALLTVRRNSENILFAKDRLKSFLKGSKILTTDELRYEVNLLPLGKKKKDELIRKYVSNPVTYLSVIEAVPSYIDVIDTVIENFEIDSKTCQELCQKLEASPEATTVLKKLVKGQSRSTPGSLVKFLRDRIEMLKAILIDQNKDIQRLWGRAKSDKTKGYLHERIIELYLTDQEVQASVEMLLMNCMTILNDEKFQNLLRKATNLFSGINLKNVLAHGNPLLEIVGRLVDPTDLPSELVRNMIQLVSDDHTLDCMVGLLDILKSDFNYFMTIMNNDNPENVSEDIRFLREEIAKCKHWVGYAKLLKNDSK